MGGWEWGGFDWQLEVAQEEGGPQPQCCLCPVQGGALKPTDIPGLWCHAACLQWIPEVSVNDPSRMEPITNIQAIQKERWELTCCLCKSGPLLAFSHLFFHAVLARLCWAGGGGW